MTFTIQAEGGMFLSTIKNRTKQGSYALAMPPVSDLWFLTKRRDAAVIVGTDKATTPALASRGHIRRR